MRLEIGQEYKHISNGDIVEVKSIKKNKVWFAIQNPKNILEKIMKENCYLTVKEFVESFELYSQESKEIRNTKVELKDVEGKTIKNKESKQLFKLTKRLKDASIAHRLLDYKGKCENLHGHTYHFEINAWFDKQQKNGITMDFNAFKEIDGWIQDNWDHGTIVKEEDQELVDFLDSQDCMFYSMVENSTVENMCKELRKAIEEGNLLKDAVRYTVKIWETETSSCEL